MSQAFIKESDGEWLHDILPTMTALLQYLSRENNGIRVYKRENYINPADGKTVHKMSNGFSYSIDANSKWYMLEED